jgi:hypothetical protein
MSKFLNRIAPQDEVLLETDIGTMIPSAEQLVEERVTRFNADKEIRLRVKALEESGSAIEEAKAAAEQASKAAQQAEDAKDAIGDVGERLEALETLDGVFDRRDIFGELQKVFPAETANFKHADIAIRSVVTTANGNIVVYAQHVNNWNRLYVIGKDGTILAEQKSAHGMEFTVRQWLVQSGDAVYFLTKTACYKITDTETNATIESIGNLDLNGLATDLPASSIAELPTRTMTIGDKIIIYTLVIDLTLLKVVQVLASGVVAPYTENGEYYATFANGNIAQLTVSADGLIVQADFVNTSGTLIHKNAYMISNQNTTTACFLLPSKTTVAQVYLAYKYAETKYGNMSILPILPNTAIGRDKISLALSTDGNIVRCRSYQKAAYVEGVGLGMLKIPFRSFPIVVGVDDGGLWAMEGYTSVWAGCRPTRALVRVNF